MSFQLTFLVYWFVHFFWICFRRQEQTVTWLCSITPRGLIMEWPIPSVLLCSTVTWSEPPLTLPESSSSYTAGTYVGHLNHCTWKKLHTSIKGKRICFVSFVKCIAFFSAGVGRTGTYIALDALFREGEITGKINVPMYVRTMRKDRINMIQGDVGSCFD